MASIKTKAVIHGLELGGSGPCVYEETHSYSDVPDIFCTEVEKELEAFQKFCEAEGKKKAKDKDKVTGTFEYVRDGNAVSWSHPGVCFNAWVACVHEWNKLQARLAKFNDQYCKTKSP